ncbi:MAG: hypothetical protein Q9162_007521 [Coniocarpon cinnabarinum]
MSENIPESVPTSSDRKSHRPVKKARRDGPGAHAQASAVEALFEKQPDIQIPTSATKPHKTTANLAAPPEIVTNVQGSSAGAGSGEFHVYKASRRREYERIRLMEDEAKREDETKEWEEKQRELKEKDENKTSKNRRRREKIKAKQDQGKKGKANGEAKEVDGGGMDGVKKIKPLEIKRSENDDDADDAKEKMRAPADNGMNGEPNDEGGIVMHDED